MKQVTFITTCSWCRKTISVQYGVEVSDFLASKEKILVVTTGVLAGVALAAVESHGCCPSCATEARREIDALPTVGNGGGA